MKKEDKELLLKDLCARLPYGVVINIGDRDLKLDRQHQNIGILYPEDCSDEFNERNNNSAFYIIISGCYYGEDIKPYLRPMSSMTEEEVNEWVKASNMKFDMEDGFLDAYDAHLSIDWLNKYHFDYRGLIPMGLALEAPEDMYK